MRIVVVVIAALVGGLVGTVIGFALAMMVSKPRNDGTFGMRELLVCVPLGGLLGLVVGIWWGATTRLVG